MLAKSFPATGVTYDPDAEYDPSVVPPYILPYAVREVSKDGLWLSAKVTITNEIIKIILCSLSGMELNFDGDCDATTLELELYMALPKFDSPSVSAPSVGALDKSWFRFSFGLPDVPSPPENGYELPDTPRFALSLKGVPLNCGYCGFKEFKGFNLPTFSTGAIGAVNPSPLPGATPPKRPKNKGGLPNLMPAGLLDSISKWAFDGSTFTMTPFVVTGFDLPSLKIDGSLEFGVGSLLGAASCSSSLSSISTSSPPSSGGSYLPLLAFTIQIGGGITSIDVPAFQTLLLNMFTQAVGETVDAIAEVVAYDDSQNLLPVRVKVVVPTFTFADAALSWLSSQTATTLGGLLGTIYIGWIVSIDSVSVTTDLYVPTCNSKWTTEVASSASVEVTALMDAASAEGDLGVANGFEPTISHGIAIRMNTSTSFGDVGLLGLTEIKGVTITIVALHHFTNLALGSSVMSPFIGQWSKGYSRGILHVTVDSIELQQLALKVFPGWSALPFSLPTLTQTTVSLALSYPSTGEEYDVALLPEGLTHLTRDGLYFQSTLTLNDGLMQTLICAVFGLDEGSDCTPPQMLVTGFLQLGGTDALDNSYLSVLVPGRSGSGTPFLSVGDSTMTVVGFGSTTTMEMQVNSLKLKLPSRQPLDDPDSWDIIVDQSITAIAHNAANDRYAELTINWNQAWNNPFGVQGLTLRGLSLGCRYTVLPQLLKGPRLSGTAEIHYQERLTIAVGVQIGVGLPFPQKVREETRSENDLSVPLSETLACSLHALRAVTLLAKSPLLACSLPRCFSTRAST